MNEIKMDIMKKQISIFILTLGIATLCSCNEWLTVTPKGQVEASDLLETSEGYSSALGGIYYTLMQENLYGCEMTYGVLDLMAQYWKKPSKSSELYPITEFDYTHKYSIDRINAFWSKFYLCIAQCNQLLESLNERNPKDIDQYNLIKGEITGLRAFLHLQLLRLYGPVVTTAADLSQPAIAYREHFDTEALKFNTVKEVLDMARKDLSAALELLNDDPIKVNGRTGNGNISTINYQDVLDRRGSRMNYFAVLGLLARLEQLALNQDGAYSYAKRILDESKNTIIDGNPIFRLTPKEDITTDQEVFRDIMFSSELLFSLYINNLYDITGPIFGYKDYTVNNKHYQSADKNTNAYLYGQGADGSGTDYRLNYWFANSTQFVKYKVAPELANSTYRAYRPEISLLRLPEIYYIACEAQIGKDNKLAMEYLNEVRVSRGLQALKGNYSNDEVMDYLVREQRKEFFGEGRMFFLYKRLNRDMQVAATNKITVSPAILQLPIPEDEYEFSPNEK